MERPGRDRVAVERAVGASLGEDAIHLVRVVVRHGAPPEVAAAATIEVARGAIERGLVRSAGILPAAVTEAIGRFVRDDPVRVALATGDCCVVPLGGHAPAALDALVMAMPRAASGDAAWADTVAFGGRATSIAGAWRSSILRTVASLRRTGATRLTIDAAPLSLVGAAVALIAPPVGGWTISAVHGRQKTDATLSRGQRVSGATSWSPEPRTPSLRLTTAGGSDEGPRLADALGVVPARHLAPSTALPVVPFLAAFGAALAEVDRRRVASPDLASAVLVRPIGGAGSEMPRWAVERIVDGPETARPAARRQTRRAARSGP